MENQAIGQGQTLDGVNQSGMNATATLGQDQYPITNQNTGPPNTVPNTATPPASTPPSTGTIGLAGPSPTDLGGMSPLPNPMMPFLNTWQSDPGRRPTRMGISFPRRSMRTAIRSR